MITFTSLSVTSLQYGSTNAQNRLGVSFLGKAGFDVSDGGLICSFCKGSNEGPPLSDFILGIPITFGSTGFPEFGFNFLMERMSFDEMPRFPGDGGPYKSRYHFYQG